MESIKSKESNRFLTSRNATSQSSPKQSSLIQQYSNQNNNSLFNAFQINRLYIRFLAIAKTYSINLLIQIFLNIVYYELSYQGDISKAIIIINLMLADSLVSILLSILTLKSRNQWHMAERKNQKVVGLHYLALDWIIILAQPYQFFQQIYFENWNQRDKVYFPYRLNYLLVILSLLKLSLILPCLIYFLKFQAPATTRVCKIYNAENTYMFSIKCFFKQHTIISTIVLFFFSLLVFSYVYRVSQRDPHIYQNQFQYFQNCLWLAFITMTTVGFGDFSTITQMGRTFGFACTICGVLIVSIMVLVVINTFEMDVSQEQALKLLKILAQKKKMKKIAGQYLRISLWRVWKNKKLRLQGKHQLIQQETMKQKDLKWNLNQSRRLLKYINIKQKSLGIYMERQFEKTKLYLQNLNKNTDALLNFLSRSHVINIQKIQRKTKLHFSTNN